MKRGVIVRQSESGDARQAEDLLPGEPTKDTLEVLKLLLEAMRVEGVEFVSIDERGKVSIRRRVTISSNLSL